MRGPRFALFSLVLLTMGVANAWASDRWMDVPTPPPMPDPIKSGLAPVNGIEMYYAVFGPAEGSPILLIHGGLGYADIWANQVADLSRDHRVIVADSRGHGRSTRNADPFGYDLMAADYLALLDYLEVPKVSLVGWSDGAIIGFDIALHHPERLEKLFAHAGNVTVDGVKPTVAEDKVFNTYIEDMGAVYRRVSPTPDQYDAFVAQISEMWATQPNWSASDIAGIPTPTEVVLGDHDEAISLEHT
ncbi:MAG: alpha/beta fold hydrolase, partial [Rhodospirillum sp.]|nr:alpha/beta fold hydrolase [Rhodospirillum sp.]